LENSAALRNNKIALWLIAFLAAMAAAFADFYPLCSSSNSPPISRLPGQRQLICRNLGGRPRLTGARQRGFDSEGDVDVLVNCMNDVPQLLRCDSTLKHNWIKIKLIGVKSNRSAIGTRVYCRSAYNNQGHNQMQEVRSGGSYISQSDLRLHFGLGSAKQCSLEIHWPSGQTDKIADAPVNKIVTIVEGKGIR